MSRTVEVKALKEVPVWLPVVISVVTILTSVGAGYTTSQMTNAFQDRRLDAIEADRAKKIEDYSEFKQEIRLAVQRLDDRTKVTSDTVNRIADKLGVIR